ncbi:retrovirus-related Pol polyprotein from transposon 297 [Elysia marginata]|uniref:Retrovirus-related Pol polyprotein from transposon 297 n=1 Tax=Elysia marginata TaxID=1093978 RepID=A0AAV4FJ42_9GAST|nr:retrovirus-related Pol polyprotein from transposon 297 [Elysia marginata]
MIEGVVSSKLRKKALRDKVTLHQFLQEARNEELTNKQVGEIEREVGQAAAISRKPRHLKIEGSQSQAGASFQPKHKGTYKQGRPFGNKSKCRNCGGTFPHPSTRQCPAKGKTCHSCGKTNHFASVCRSSEKQERHKTAVKKIHHEDDESDSDSAGVLQINTKKSIPTVTADLCSNQVKFIVDTGASVNILTKTSFDKMHKKPILRPDPIAIYGYSNSEKLDVLGRFTASIQCNGEKTQVTFYVVQTPEKACNLLSATTSQELKIISFLNNVTISENLFEGFGKIKGIKIKLHIDEKVQPVAQKHRRIPYHIRKDTEAELKRLEKQDIIENAEGPTPWVSPIVVIPKKTGGVRLCVDMRRANEAIKRERHPMPTLEEVINELNSSKFFSRLDLKQAFHQLELSEESRHITTFATHVGLRRYKRLMFGINAAPELFQHHLNQILHDIQGATFYIDDVIIFGKTREEHDRNLQATLDRLQERGVKLNKDKCLFGAQKLTFLGHVFGEDGIHLEPQKIKCISEATAPTNIAAVRSFLGMTQYVSRFIRGYATITEPLRMLTKKTQPWT